MSPMHQRPLPPATDRRDGVKGALLHTLPGRAIVVGVAIKLVIFAVGVVFGRVPAFLGVVDVVAGTTVVEIGRAHV